MYTTTVVLQNFYEISLLYVVFAPNGKKHFTVTDTKSLPLVCSTEVPLYR